MTSLAEFVKQAIETSHGDEVGWRPALEALETAQRVFSDLPELAEPGLKIRTHGDLHLGQVLYTGDDIVFIDFEGDVTRPLGERLIKTSPLADVASMLYSFRYATISGCFRQEGTTQRNQSADDWYSTVGPAFADTYFDTVAGKNLIPSAKSEFERLVRIYLVSKGVYQLAYELRHRPDWVPIARRALVDLVPTRQ